MKKKILNYKIEIQQNIKTNLNYAKDYLIFQLHPSLTEKN